MNIFVMVTIAVGLSADAFTVAVANSSVRKTMPVSYGLWMAVSFGFFQFLMPIIGWLVGIRFARYIEVFDHWIAFSLLSYIGGKMLWEGLSSSHKTSNEALQEQSDKKNITTLLLLSIATSIDALAVGLTFAMIGTHIFVPSLVIGFVTFLLSLIGFFLGRQIVAKLMIKPDICGGIILIGIGIKILIEHLRA